MKTEPKTPLQLRAESMVKEDEALEASGPQPIVRSEDPAANEEDMEDERKEVALARISGRRTNPCWDICSVMPGCRFAVVWAS
jgi:hypothetical protein